MPPTPPLFCFTLSRTMKTVVAGAFGANCGEASLTRCGPPYLRFGILRHEASWCQPHPPLPLSEARC